MRTPNVSNGKECCEKPEAEDAFIPSKKNFTEGTSLSTHCGYRVIVT